MKANYKIEGVVLCEPVADSAEVEAMHSEAISILNKYQRRLFMAGCTGGINSASQAWADYLADKRTLLNGLSAERALIVPQLHSNDLGVLAGRLANSKASIADSPIRVDTGALVGLGETPLDSAGDPLDMDTLTQLDAARFSVVQTYPDYDGVYFGDGNMIDLASNKANNVF